MLDKFTAIAGKVINDAGRVAANTTLTFNVVPDDATVTIGDDGNPVIETIETETITVECYLARKKQPLSDVEAGVNLDKDYFEGRLVDPLSIDFPINNLAVVEGVINGRSADVFIQNMMESPTSEQYDMKGSIGQRIAVYATFKQGN